MRELDAPDGTFLVYSNFGLKLFQLYLSKVLYEKPFHLFTTNNSDEPTRSCPKPSKASFSTSRAAFISV